MTNATTTAPASGPWGHIRKLSLLGFRPGRRPAGRTAAAKKVGSWLAVIALVAMLLVALVALLAPPVMGWRFLVVTGGSMEPTIRLGSLAVMADADGTDVRAGDIVTVHVQGGTRTHRVISVSADGRTLVTKGDANGSLDPAPVPTDAVTGSYLFSVPYAGTVIHLAASRLGYILLVLVPAAILLGGQVLALHRYARAKWAGRQGQHGVRGALELASPVGPRGLDRFKANHSAAR